MVTGQLPMFTLSEIIQNFVYADFWVCNSVHKKLPPKLQYKVVCAARASKMHRMPRNPSHIKRPKDHLKKPST